MKLVNYRCTNCGKDIDIILHDNEKEPKSVVCPFCNSEAEKFNFKNNSQRYRFMD